MFTLYNDGASNQGQVFEGFNLAKLWDLPWMFVCENNKYRMGTSAERSSSNTEYFTYGNKISTNGMNVITSVQYNVLAECYQYLCGVEVKAPCTAKVVKLATTLPPDDNKINNNDDGDDDSDDGNDDSDNDDTYVILSLATLSITHYLS
jgi:hypothetical protein